MLDIKMIPLILSQRETKQKLFIGGSCIILVCISFASGVLFSSAEAIQEKEQPVFTSDINPQVPFLTILGVEGRVLQMSTKDIPIRIMYGDTAYNAPSNSEFQLNLFATGTTLPEGEPRDLNTPCTYVASQTGKYAYIEGSSQASRIKNRKCYASITDAEDDGYTLYDK